MSWRSILTPRALPRELGAQQCVEKGFKAVLEKHEGTVPNIHNLITLYGRAEKYLPPEIDVDLDMLDRLNALYIDARYPGERGLLPEGKPSKAEAQQFHAFAGTLFETIRRHAEGN